jgi:hypothetical protein
MGGHDGQSGGGNPHCSWLADRLPEMPNGARLGGFSLAVVAAMQVQDHAEIVHLLAELRMEHRDLDLVIEQLATAIGRDELQLTRLKKRKLLLKDHIARLESKLIPDLDA